jgi:hypothetical protein
MKKLFIGFLGFLFCFNILATDASFNINLKLLKPITLTKIQDLVFPDTVLPGINLDVIVTPLDVGASIFNATGGKNRTITRTILESSVILTSPDSTTTVLVDNFTISGPTAFNVFGEANNIRIGATARILSTNEEGKYAGIATLRVVYQ